MSNNPRKRAHAEETNGMQSRLRTDTAQPAPDAACGIRGRFQALLPILLTILLAIALTLAVLEYFNLLPHRAYTAKELGITELKSAHDADGDGIDDYTDIMLGARAFVAQKPLYKSEYYPDAYPPAGIGVCTDVVWYAFREAGYDLRAMVDSDIAERQDAYPAIEKPDSNIDFRRVVNLRVFFEQHAEVLTTETHDPSAWQAGDIVIYDHHIAVCSDKRNRQGLPYIIHHGGQPVYEEDALTRSGILGHYRWSGSLN